MDLSLTGCRFLLAELQLDYVLGKIDPREMNHALDSLPTGVTEVYNDILDRIGEKGADAKQFAMRVLSLIFYAARPLRMTELREALSVREGDRELNEQFMLHPSAILQVCQSLVTYEERNDVVRFTHYSVQEFLAGCKLLSHDVAAKACLASLEFDMLEKGSYSQIPLLLHQDGPVTFLRYALEFWGFHAKAAGESPDVQKAVLKILGSENKRKWILQFEMQLYAIGGVPHKVNEDLSLLQVIAKNGLATTCRIVLDRR